ncbi:hypothetical protein GE061_007576 [Apolygus lucorum]|uniref:Uncharacterized protein n=1 Tax=Apolygus lucorum TaxID=248454 RepID=A0A6A4J2N8_APOLU|nr:hypothetical protein GE061_007576 [Apolygus lucorum]
MMSQGGKMVVCFSEEIPESFKIQRGSPYYIPEHTPGRLPAVGEVAERYQVISDTCYRVCFCTRRNGLQDSCPLTGCGGKPRCLTTPLPSCDPSGFAPKKSSKDVEYILCPAIKRESKRSLCKRHPSSAPVSQASHCDPKSTKTY